MEDQIMNEPMPLTYYRENEVIKNELYSTQITEIIVNPDMFHNITGNLYPKKGLTNDIGSASGIEFLPTVKDEPVYGDEIINPDGSKSRKLCGVKTTKQGRRMRPDGSWQLSSPCTYEFNWMDRAELDFIATPDKYKSEIAQRKHILELKKFASQRASTGAELMVIRELTGMPTAFKKEELDNAGGKMVFSQIVKSQALQAAEARARVENIRTGGLIADSINNAANLLTGKTTDAKADFNSKFTRPETAQPDPEPEPEESPIKSRATELLGKIGELNRDAFVYYNAELDRNAWSDGVCEWAIAEMEKNFPGVVK
jgi:hypothetical protein